MTWTPKYTITKEILSYLTKIESIKNSFEDKPLSPVLLSSLHQSAKISSTHYSTKIEGNHLSLKQVENALYYAMRKIIPFFQCLEVFMIMKKSVNWLNDTKEKISAGNIPPFF